MNTLYGFTTVCMAIVCLFLSRNMTFLINFILFNYQKDTCHFPQLLILMFSRHGTIKNNFLNLLNYLNTLNLFIFLSDMVTP